MGVLTCSQRGRVEWGDDASSCVVRPCQIVCLFAGARRVDIFALAELGVSFCM